MAYVQSTAPTAEPFTFTEVLVPLRLNSPSSSSERTYLELLIATARQFVEVRTNRQLMTATWDLSLDAFCGEICLEWVPVQSVSYIKYYDSNNVQQTLSSAKYQVDLASEPARIYPVYGEVWPVTYPRMNAVTIRFVAGYASAAAIPQAAKQLMLFLIGQWYQTREPVNIGDIVTPIPNTLNALLWPLKAKVGI